jgi:signal transduction histidine kinase
MPRSFAWRMAAAAAAAMLLVSLATGAWVWWQAEVSLRSQLDRALAAEAESLLRDLEPYGMQGLAEQVELTRRRRGPVLALLQAQGGQIIAGAMPAAPPFLRGYATLEAPGRSLRALGLVLPGGVNLIVAGDLAAVEQAAAALARSPPIAALVAAALALLLGLLAARRLEARLAQSGAAARAIMDGDLTRRLPGNPEGDEFDRLGATINLLLGRIEALVAAQRQVTDDIAHDLRTPLSHLRQRLEAAAAAPRIDPAVIEAAIGDLDAVLASFAALLRISRVESGAGRAGFAAVDLSALATTMAETYGAVAEEAGRALEARIAPGGVVQGDAALLRQALANLLDNAMLHGAGVVRLKLSHGGALMVADDGPGIPEGEREAVLRRFHRLEVAQGRPGSGLGLALVAATARMHGARLVLGGEQGLEVRLEF